MSQISKIRSFVLCCSFAALCAACHQSNENAISETKPPNGTNGLPGADSSSRTNQSKKAAVKMYQFPNPFIEGDFDGDGKKEKLQSQLYSKRDKKVMTEYPEDCDIGCICEYDPELLLRPDHPSMPNLRLGENTCQIYGLARLANIGDLNGNGTDEIALIVNWADQSGLNSCYIYGLCENEWKKLFSFQISESSLTADGESSSDPSNISHFIFKRADKYYFYEYDLAEIVVKPMNMEKLASCSKNKAWKADDRLGNEKIVTLSGKLTEEMHYGPPNYGDSPATDKKEYFYFINLASAIDTRKYLDEEVDSSYKEIKKLQIFMNDDLSKYKANLNKKVKLKGSLFLAHTGHHHTPVLLDVIEIIEP